jgi:uncharacterized membrane protein HdeD (DUF308 family)
MISGAAAAVAKTAMLGSRKFVRQFSLEHRPHGGRYGWYVLKKAALLSAIISVALLANAWLSNASPWWSIGIPSVIAVGGFWLSGQIRMRHSIKD